MLKKGLRIVRWSAILTVILTACLAFVNAQANNTPESRVKDFYSWYLKAKASKKDPDKNRAVMKSHVSRRFSKWFYSKEVQNSDVGIFYNKGDWKRAWAHNIEVGEPYFMNDDQVVVKVKLSSPPDEFEMKLQVFLVKEGGKWKIDRVAGYFE